MHHFKMAKNQIKRKSYMIIKIELNSQINCLINKYKDVNCINLNAISILVKSGDID